MIFPYLIWINNQKTNLMKQSQFLRGGIVLIVCALCLASYGQVELRNNVFSEGGGIRINDENEITSFVLIEPDLAGTGVFAQMLNGNGVVGFRYDGDSFGSGSPIFEILGNSAFSLDMSIPGDPSVLLPIDAVNATEILNESGVANDLSTSTSSLSGTPSTLATQTITVPTDGYVLAIGSLQVNLVHSNGTQTYGEFGISQTNNSFPSHQDMAMIIPSSAPTGTFHLSTTVSGIFTVTAGAQTFYLLGEENSGVVSANDKNLSLLFVPTNYGTVTSNILVLMERITT